MDLIRTIGRGYEDPTVRRAAMLVIVVLGGLIGAAVFPMALPWNGGGIEVVDVSPGTAPDSVTVTVSQPFSGDRTLTIPGDGDTVVDPAADIAFVPREQLPPELERVLGNHQAGVGVVGPWAVVGPLSVSRVTIGGNEVLIVAPANGTVDPGQKAYFLKQFVNPYTLDSGAPERITIYAGPRALPGVGRMYPDDTGYVAQEGFWDGKVESVWIHEYVHARQNMDLTEEMRWFEEASAVYLSLRMMEEQYDPVTDGDVARRLASLPDGEPVSLADPVAWQTSHTDYRRGTKLVARIDDRVRSETGGTHSIVSVIRQLNAADEPVDIDQFVTTLEELTEEDEQWVRDRITEVPAVKSLNDSSGSSGSIAIGPGS
jgi:hypothetical protein